MRLTDQQLGTERKVASSSSRSWSTHWSSCRILLGMIQTIGLDDNGMSPTRHVEKYIYLSNCAERKSCVCIGLADVMFNDTENYIFVWKTLQMPGSYC